MSGSNRRVAGRGRGGRTAGRGGTSHSPPPPPPPPNTLLEDAAAQLANINDSPATQTRQQCLLALHTGANTDSDALQTGANTDLDADIVEHTPTQRRHQQRKQLAVATTRACTVNNNYVQQFFAETGNESDKD